MAMTTKHTCGGPVWGRLTRGCPRCDELIAGAAPIRWANASREDARRSAEITSHMASAAHRSGGCGIVCTHGEW